MKTSIQHHSFPSAKDPARLKLRACFPEKAMTALAVSLFAILCAATSLRAAGHPQSLSVTSEGTQVDGDLNITGELKKNGMPWTQSLTPATAATLGGVKIGANLSITADGTLSAISGGGGLWEQNASNIYRASGNVGIGKSSPTALLHLNGSGNPIMGIENASAPGRLAFLMHEWAGGASILNFGINANQAGAGNYNQAYEGGFFRIDTRASQAFEFFSVRRQAAGTTAETVLFSVSNAADARVHHYLAVNKGASATPAYPLDVAGDINFTGALRKDGAEWNPGGGGALTIHPVEEGESNNYYLGPGDASLHGLTFVLHDMWGGDNQVMVWMPEDGLVDGTSFKIVAPGTATIWSLTFASSSHGISYSFTGYDTEITGEGNMISLTNYPFTLSDRGVTPVQVFNVTYCARQFNVSGAKAAGLKPPTN